MRKLILGSALVLVMAACGGGDSDSGGDATTTTAGGGSGQTTTTTQSTSTTSDSSSGPGSNTEFCGFDEDINSALTTLFNLDVAALEDTVENTVELAQRATESAPGEIKDAAMVLLEGFSGFADFLKDINFDPINNPDAFETDPRVLYLESAEYTAAARAVTEFCGGDVDTNTTTPGSGSILPGGVSTDIPDDFPAELVPPGVTAVQSVEVPGAFNVSFDTEASFDDVVAFYTDAEGPPASLLDAGGSKTALWVPAAPLISIVVQEDNGQVIALVTGAA